MLKPPRASIRALHVGPRAASPCLSHIRHPSTMPPQTPRSQQTVACRAALRKKSLDA
jgi:hypothetical protein